MMTRSISERDMIDRPGEGHNLFFFLQKYGYNDGLKVHLYNKQSWNVPIFSICHILVALCMDETQMHIYRREGVGT